VFILKKDGFLKLYIDYRKLNRVSIKNRYILFSISEILDKILKTSCFFKINVKIHWQKQPLLYRFSCLVRSRRRSRSSGYSTARPNLVPCSPTFRLVCPFGIDLSFFVASFLLPVVGDNKPVLEIISP
jgi:hypothetical protein